MKIRSLSQMQDALDKDLSWRFKEIIFLKSNIKSTSSISKPTFIRAGTALLYAHWEGFIKQSSMIYIDYLNSLRIEYKELKTPLIVLGFKSHIESVRTSGNVVDNAQSMDFIRSNMTDRFGVNSGGAINTYSNLNSKVFNNIASSLCISVTPYESKFNLIDESLLKRRNKVAHGEFVDISNEDWRSLADEVLVLLRTYKNDLENAASVAGYKAT